jgi:hypothetical protein
MSKVVTVRTTGYPSTEAMQDIVTRVREWDWRGEKAVPVRLEYGAMRGSVQHFPFGEVRFDRASADALLTTLMGVDAIIYSTPRDEVPRVELKKVRVPRRW